MNSRKALGLVGQGISDALSGNLSGWQDYTGAAIGGAAGGWALLYTGPVAAGAIGGAMTSASKQALNKLTGAQDQLSGSALLIDTGIGAATGLIPGVRIPGITAGRNSYNAIYNQMATKFENGTISQVTLPTAGKMFVGRSVDTSLLPGTGAGAVAGWGFSGGATSSSQSPCNSQSLCNK